MGISISGVPVYAHRQSGIRNCGMGKAGTCPLRNPVLQAKVGTLFYAGRWAKPGTGMPNAHHYTTLFRNKRFMLDEMT